MEGELLKLLRQTKEAGGWASLTFTTPRGGKLIAKLEVELEPSAPACSGVTSSSPATAPASGGGRRRRKGAAAKAKARARAALHRATQAAATPPPPASGDASAPLAPPLHLPPLPSIAPSSKPARQPLRHLISPSPTSGRQRVMSLGRMEMPSFSTLNLDGSSSPSPAPPPPSPPPSEVTDCDECGEKFKCGEDFEDHLIWCPWCDDFKGCSGQPDCGHFYVQVVP